MALDAGRNDEAVGLFEAAAAWFLTAGDRSQSAKAVTRIGTALIYSGRTKEAAERLEIGLRDVSLTGDEEGYALLTAELARAYMLEKRDAELIISTADRAIGTAERLDLVATVAEALITMGTAITDERPREGTAILLGALALAEAHGLVHAQLRALNNASVFMSEDDPVLDRDLSRRGIELAGRRLGAIDSVARFASAMAYGDFWAGRWDDSLAQLDAVDDDDLGPLSRSGVSGTRELVLAYLGRREERRWNARARRRVSPSSPSPNSWLEISRSARRSRSPRAATRTPTPWHGATARPPSTSTEPASWLVAPQSAFAMARWRATRWRWSTVPVARVE